MVLHCLLPNGFCQLETQVAGHYSGSFGLIKDPESGCVLKPIAKTFSGECELNFYLKLKSEPNGILNDIRTLMPHFHEVVNLTINKKEQAFLKLENITLSMVHPCVMDVKIGKRTWDPLATPKKRHREETKYASCKAALGFCIPGFQIYSVNTAHFSRFGKEFGKELNPTNMENTFRNFLNTSSGLFLPLILKILSKLYKIRKWFSTQTSLKFYASSILIAYDSKVLSDKKRRKICDDKNTCIYNSCFSNNESFKKTSEFEYKYDSMEEKWVQVKMIDFAHVFQIEDSSHDSNYLFGLQNLIRIIEQIVLKKQSLD